MNRFSPFSFLLTALLCLPNAFGASPLAPGPMSSPASSSALTSGTVSSAQASALSAQLTTHANQISAQANQISAQANQISALSTAVAGKQSKIAYSVKDYGAKGDGTTYDTDAIQATINAAHAAGGGVVSFPPASNPVIGYLLGGPHGTGLTLYPGISVQGNGNRLSFSVNQVPTANSFISDNSVIGGTAEIVAATSLTDTVIPVDNAAGFSVGNHLKVAVGEQPYDGPVYGEPDHWFFTTAVAVNTTSTPNTITLAAPIGYALTNDAVRPSGLQILKPQHHQITRYSSFVSNVSIDGLDLYCPPSVNCEAGLGFLDAENVSVTNITGANTGAVLVGGQYLQNFSVINCGSRQANAYNGQQSKGNAFGVAESTNISFINCYAENFQHYAFDVESNSDIHIQNMRIVNNFPGRNVGAVPLFLALGNSRIYTDDLTVEGNSSELSFGNVGVNDFEFHDFTWNCPVLPTIDDLSQLSGSIQINAGFLTGQLFKETKEVTITKTIDNAVNDNQITLPLGLIKSVKVYCSSKPSGMASYFGHVGSLTPTYQMIAGQSVRLTPIGLGGPYDTTFSLSQPRTMDFYTGGNPATFPAGVVVNLDVVYWPISGVDDGTHGLTTISQ